MTCKDCAHYEVCEIQNEIPFKKSEKCRLFKDKSKFIELPCKVGDTVYSIKDDFYNYKIHSGLQKGKVIGFEFNKKCFIWVHFKNDTPTGGIAFELNDIGKTVFLTKEEAEKSLKESERK